MVAAMEPEHLRPATPEELEQTIAHALRFDGKRNFRAAGDMMARITAAHLVEQLRRCGYVVMKSPPATPHRADCGQDPRR
jgi:hypothetical protein